MITREISTHLSGLAQKYPVITVTGPRQSGKTTLAKAVFEDKVYINLELMDNREFANEDPRGFLRRIPDGAILDEIQRTPHLASYIQGIVDEKKQNGMFILTGSQQFEVSNSINQSLAGRTALLKLLPFSLNEITDNYGYPGIDQLIYSGFYPRIYDQKLQPTQALADYFETYVERDLRQLIQIKNLSSFQKFVKLCAGRTGQLLNLNSLGNDVGISHTTAREWLTILEASYIVFLLEPFHRNIKKRLIKSPKIYFYDVGLACYLLGIESLSQLETHPLRGNLFENMVVIEILKYRYNQGKRNNLNFYRDSIGNEVDVIYNVGADIFPIEIKSAETIARDFYKGLNALEKLITNMPWGKLIIYAGDQRQTRQNLKILTITDLLDILNKINS
jgi:predicted AAA+ superfamily ATPase